MDSMKNSSRRKITSINGVSESLECRRTGRFICRKLGLRRDVPMRQRLLRGWRYRRPAMSVVEGCSMAIRSFSTTVSRTNVRITDTGMATANPTAVCQPDADPDAPGKDGRVDGVAGGFGRSLKAVDHAKHHVPRKSPNQRGKAARRRQESGTRIGVRCSRGCGQACDPLFHGVFWVRDGWPFTRLIACATVSAARVPVLAPPGHGPRGPRPAAYEGNGLVRIACGSPRPSRGKNLIEFQQDDREGLSDRDRQEKNGYNRTAEPRETRRLLK